jgi:hypothetical protein
MKKISPGVADPLPSFLADKDVKVFVTGHQGLVSSTIVRCLLALNFTNVSLRVVRKDSIDVSRVKREYGGKGAPPPPLFSVLGSDDSGDATGALLFSCSDLTTMLQELSFFLARIQLTHEVCGARSGDSCRQPYMF